MNPGRGMVGRGVAGRGMVGRGVAGQGKARQGKGVLDSKGELTILIASDMHCGHDVGLTPPDYNRKPPKAASGEEHKNWEFRVAGWEWFVKEVEKCGRFDYAIWNGDLVDGEGHKNKSTEDEEIPIQIEMAVAVITYINARENHIVRGTPYHTGESKTTWEDMVASQCHAKIGNAGHYVFNGLNVNAKHHIGNSTSPVSRYTALASAHVKQLLWAEVGQQPRADLLIRSHIHRCSNVGDPALNKQGWVTPALQGLGSIYGARQVDGLPVHFGFLVLRVKSREDWGIESHIAPMCMQAAHVIVVNK